MKPFYSRELNKGLPNFKWAIYRDEGSLAQSDTLILLTNWDDVDFILEKLNKEEPS